ncbi:hypothetical protein [Paracoccus aminophilus]|nr:hypothetical protein [Paracoccus aminophilus]
MHFTDIEQGDRGIAYLDQRLTAVMNRRSRSRTLLVTFGDMMALASGDRAWGEDLGLKHDMDVLSFMAGSRNWYPAISMMKALDLLSRALHQYDERICYGGSMGGYAALKYSSRIGADRVVAYMPQFSIDSRDVNDSRYSRHFNQAENADMAISPQDVSGAVVLVSDPGFLPDERHIERIVTEVARPVERIKVRNAEHSVTGIMAGSEMFRRILNVAAGQASAQSLAIAIREKRRNHPLAVRIFLRKLIERHPDWLAKRISIDRRRYDLKWTQLFRIFFHTQMMRNDRLWRRAERLIVRSLRARLGLSDCGDSFYLMSHHGTILCAAEDGKMFTATVSDVIADEVRPIHFSKEASGDNFYGGCRVVLHRHGVAFVKGDQYLTAERTGNKEFSAKEIGFWQMFGLC